MSIEFDTSELNELVADFAKVEAKVTVIASATMTKIARQLRDDARSSVAIDSGETRDSIHVQGGKDFRTVIADSRAAFHLEFGTSDTAPQPFMWPAAGKASVAMTEAFEAIGIPFD